MTEMFEFASRLRFFLVSFIKYKRNSMFKNGLKHFHWLVHHCTLQLVRKTGNLRIT